MDPRVKEELNSLARYNVECSRKRIKSLMKELQTEIKNRRNYIKQINCDHHMVSDGCLEIITDTCIHCGLQYQY